jgi:hypothetical protein
MKFLQPHVSPWKSEPIEMPALTLSTKPAKRGDETCGCINPQGTPYRRNIVTPVHFLISSARHHAGRSSKNKLFGKIIVKTKFQLCISPS